MDKIFLVRLTKKEQRNKEKTMRCKKHDSGYQTATAEMHYAYTSFREYFRFFALKSNSTSCRQI